MDKKLLSKYLEKLYFLEKLRYEQINMCNCLYSKINNLEQSKNRTIPFRPCQDTNMEFTFTATLWLFTGIGGDILLLCLGIFTRYTTKGFFGPIFRFFIGGALCGVVIGLILDNMERDSRMKENQENIDYNWKVSQENNKMIQGVNQKIESIRKEISIIENNRVKTEQILSKYYGLNIIYAKYQGLIPIASFYEYFKSGRCETLTGHEGAYNIYESELRMNVIISKLDVVINRLDEIRNSQYMLYDAISSSNNIAGRMLNTVNNLADNMVEVVNNQQVIAYNSRIAAQNTEFLTWLKIGELSKYY